jgi:molybdopterin-guanine dinucleotide biosynthesis protein A
VISVNSSQYNHYSKTFSKEQLVVDNELLQIRGPLAGLLSVHLQYPGEDLFILACDMPLMEVAILKELYQQYTPAKKNAVYVFSNDGEPEPLCGIYTATALAHIHQLYTSQQLTKHSMKFALEQLDTKTFTIAADDKKYFANFNAHAQLNGL